MPKANDITAQPTLSPRVVPRSNAMESSVHLAEMLVSFREAEKSLADRLRHAAEQGGQTIEAIGLAALLQEAADALTPRPGMPPERLDQCLVLDSVSGLWLPAVDGYGDLVFVERRPFSQAKRQFGGPVGACAIAWLPWPEGGAE